MFSILNYSLKKWRLTRGAVNVFGEVFSLFPSLEFLFSSRKVKGPDFPLTATGNLPNFLDAMSKRISVGKAQASQSNGDVVD